MRLSVVSIYFSISYVSKIGWRSLCNSIFSNTGLGINLPGGSENFFGVTANGAGDADTGSNNLQNFPVLTSVITTATATTISGTLDSRANSTYRIEFFASAAPDPSCHGEGQTLLGSKTVTTDDNGDGSGDASFTATTAADGLLPAPASQPFITATATNTATNDTSEFSGVFEMPSLVVTTTADVVANDCQTSLREAINFANSDPDLDTISFSIPGTGVHTITPASACRRSRSR